LKTRKRRLSDDDIQKLRKLLEQREYWTTKEVRDLIKREFDVEYTFRHVSRILREMGMNYQKLYVNDLKRPANAEDILKKTVQSGILKM
jgi:transposase